MAEKQLHIVSFNIPYPPDYGGVIEVFHKLRALREKGVEIILHCFSYGRPGRKELEGLCRRVHYYTRSAGLRHFLSGEPYIVRTRNNDLLTANLLKEPFPVFFEGLHTTAPLPRLVRAGRKVIVRAHNIEHEYYRLLAKSEPHLPRKLYLLSEARKLESYEEILSRAGHILAISNQDRSYFRRKYGHAEFVPPFHGFSEVVSAPGRGDYLLLHGNLAVPENSRAFLYLAEKVLSRCDCPVVVAGRRPSGRFMKQMARYEKVRLIGDPTGEEMESLIRNAHINLLYTHQPTGLKLKLIHSLFAGRHCVANSGMVSGSGLEGLCRLEDHPDGMVRSISELMRTPFTSSDLEKRKAGLQDYSNASGAEKILGILD